MIIDHRDYYNRGRSLSGSQAGGVTALFAGVLVMLAMGLAIAFDDGHTPGVKELLAMGLAIAFFREIAL